MAQNDRWPAVGLDIEEVAPPDERLWGLNLCPEEVDWAKAAGWLGPGVKAKLLFSAKECVYKCLCGLVGMPLEFKDVRIDVGEAPSQFRGLVNTSGRHGLNGRLFGRFAFAGSAIMMAWPA